MRITLCARALRQHCSAAALIRPGHSGVYDLCCLQGLAALLQPWTGIDWHKAHSTSTDSPSWLTGRLLQGEEHKRSKADAYKRNQERTRETGQGPSTGGAQSAQDVPPTADLLPPSSALTSAAYASAIERQIQEGIKAGALDNLRGRGEPLPARHDAQFFRVDPLMAALGRAMGAQKLRPRSLDLRDELQQEQDIFERAVGDAARRLVAKGLLVGAGADRSRAAIHARDTSGTGSGTTGSGSSSSSSSGRSPQSPTPIAVRQGTAGTGRYPAREARVLAAALAEGAVSDGGLAAVHGALTASVRAYNSAVLGDKETYGSAWPLEPRRILSFQQACEAALQQGEEAEGA